LRPGRPRAYAAILGLAAIGAGIAVAISGLPSPVQVAALPVVAWIAWRAWRRQRGWVGCLLRLHGDGRVEWAAPGSGVVVAGRLVAHWQSGPLAALVLATHEGGDRSVERIAVWRDQIDRDAWRRLSILLRHLRHRDGALG
jgi:hypothetical protein